MMNSLNKTEAAIRFCILRVFPFICFLYLSTDKSTGKCYLYRARNVQHDRWFRYPWCVEQIYVANKEQECFTIIVYIKPLLTITTTRVPNWQKTPVVFVVNSVEMTIFWEQNIRLGAQIPLIQFFKQIKGRYSRVSGGFGRL